MMDILKRVECFYFSFFLYFIFSILVIFFVILSLRFDSIMFVKFFLVGISKLIERKIFYVNNYDVNFFEIVF